MSYSTSSSTATQLHFHGPYRRQNWSIPGGIIYYMAQNPSSSNVYEKLIKTCKYFFSINPIAVCTQLQSRDDDHERVGEWTISKNDRFYTIDLNDFSSTKLWITYGIDIDAYYTKRNLVSDVVPHIYRNDAKETYLSVQDLSIDKLLLLVSSAEFIEFTRVIVKDENGSKVGIEKILEAAVKAKEFRIVPQNTGTNVSSKTVKNLLQLPQFVTLKTFHVDDILEAFDLDAFFTHVKYYIFFINSLKSYTYSTIINMSGSTRKDLGRTRGNANKHLRKYQEMVDITPAPWNDTTKSKFRALMNRMKDDLDHFDEYFNNWDTICTGITDADDADAERELYEQWKDEYDEVIEDLKTTVEEITQDLKLNISIDNISNISLPSSRGTTVGVTATVPQLNLPKFSGDYLKWNPFWQRFDHAVHSKDYPKIEKLISLLGYLEGKALDEVEGFTVSEENYDTIVETLINRFGKKSLVIIELQTKLRGIETATSNPENFRNTVNMICNMCRQLENLGVDVDNYSTKMDIIEKMPSREKDELKWLLISDPDDTTIDKLMDKMKEIALKAELATRKQPFFDPKASAKFQANRRPSDLHSNSKPTDTGGGYKCCLCDELHHASKCTKFTSADDKLRQLRSKNYCTKCALNNHDTKNCFKKMKCYLCEGNHTTFLCTSKKATNSNKTTNLVTVQKKQGMLLTKQVTIINPDTKETTETVVIFDSGSQQSYISNKIIEQLKLDKISDEELHVTGFGAKATKYTSALIKFELETNDGYKKLYVNSTEKIATTVPVVYAETFEEMDIKTIYKAPDILIGMDYFFEFVTSFEKLGENRYIVDSTVGKMLCKVIPKFNSSTISSLAIESPQSFCEDENELQKFWNLEDMGIKDSIVNDEEAIILEKFKENVKFKNNRYYVSWPEKEKHEQLPTNAGLALGRLRSTFKRLSGDTKLMNDCEKILNDQISRGTVEVAPHVPEGNLVHYLSSHAVITPEKTTTKVRMVYDASAKISKLSPSLNDCLIRGPLNMPDLGGILLRIRRGRYMLVGDIEKAFHQVYLNEKDRDAVRFFWAKDSTKPLTNDNIIAYRFIGVPFGVISSPFILWIIILLHLQKLDNEKLRNIDENFYVDNIFLLVDDIMEGIEQFKTIREHFLQASFNIREWLSNDPQINKTFPEQIRQKTLTTKILGLNWSSENDTLKIELKHHAVTADWTKRKVLKFIASTFDPLGFLSPVTVKGRVFMQKLFQEKLKWDESLNTNLSEQWEVILKDWNGYIEIPRKYIDHKFPENHHIRIHAFADASQQAYCTCLYIRIKTGNGYETPLVFAKTRLQPLNKKLTIPKLEIMGIWLAAKIITYVAKQMKLENCEKFIWTDSQISYYWFQKHPKDVFVTNRLKEVLQSKAICNFVPGNLNPADLGTRGISFEELKNSECWWKGPRFLQQKRDDWPQLPQQDGDLTKTVIALVATNEIAIPNTDMTREFEIETSIPYAKIKYVVAGKLQQKQEQDITVSELIAAEKQLIVQEQRILTKPKDMMEFKLFKDEDGIYRINCRFDHADLINPHPIFLPKDSPLVKVIILHIHQKLHHSGIPHTLSKIREDYWIPSGRNTVKKVLSKCKECKIWKGKSFVLPKMPQLPSSRVNISKPFQNVGIDYCGPFKVKGSKEKVWISLFTCFTTRLIHLEPVTSMTTEDFLFAFRRFVARRGCPCYILSDNAKQFKSAATALDEIWKSAIIDKKIVTYCNDNAILWDYITERAPWKGGLYERMVGLVKNALKLTIGRRFINFVEFWTFLCEVEATINSRPLTYVHSKEPFIIRPIDFITPKMQVNLPTVTVDNENNDPTFLPTSTEGGERLFEHYKKTTEYLQKFWDLWNKDYLNFLRERNDEHKKHRGSLQRQPKLNETVLVYEPNVGRGLWKYAKIVELMHSKDNEIRSVKIEYKNGFVTNRAVNHLFPVEEEFNNLDSETDLDQNNDNTLNLHITDNKNEHSLLSNKLPYSFNIQSSHSSKCILPSTYSSFENSSILNLFEQNKMSIKSSSHLSLEEVSSGSLSATESEHQSELREIRRAESIIRKELKETKKILQTMMEEYKVILLKIETRLDHGLLAGHFVIELNQLNERITTTITARDKLFKELREVRSEGIQARKAIIEKRRK